jgi:hypothetical protein
MRAGGNRGAGDNRVGTGMGVIENTDTFAAISQRCGIRREPRLKVPQRWLPLTASRNDRSWGFVPYMATRMLSRAPWL